EFGIVWLAERAGLRQIGCAARIARVLERMEDGRMNLLVEGTTPFTLLRRIEDLPYPAGDVRLLDDEDDSDAAGQERAREAYAQLVERVTDTRPDAAELARLDAYGMAATVEFALDAKQDLLELRSERRRLERVAELFSTALARVERATRIAERARGNGRVEFPS
ncbi:MAG: LON peptidase substrate-binding domain-containing protein, partial [Nocardioidaceae bacterium]